MTNIPGEKYKEILDSIPVCCVDILVYHKGKVLLVYRKNKPAKDEWWPPGGRVHKHELLETAAIRKVFEETGLKVKLKNKIGVYDAIFPDGPFPNLKSGVHTIGICFLAEPLSENPVVKLDNAHSDFKWIDKIDENLPQYTKRVIKDANIFKK